MRPQWVLLPLLSTLAAADLVVRQTPGTSVSSSSSEDETTSPTPTPTDGGGDDDDDDDDGDVTTTITTTVPASGDASTSTKTVRVTSTVTVVQTSTDFRTVTVTSEDEETATSTVYETTTQWVTRDANADNAKRELEPAQTIAAPAQVAAVATDAPVPTPTPEVVDVRVVGLEMAKRIELARRDTITSVVTVTGESDASSVVETSTQTLTSSTTTQTVTTRTVTETFQANAKTTTSVTSTLTVTSTSVSTGVTGPTETSDGGNSGNGDGSGDDSGGLSTPAKIGIGVGVGVGALAILAGLLFFCLRRRRSGPKPEHDDLIGASEVPVGAAAGGAGAGAGAAAVAAGRRGTPPMSQTPSSPGASNLTPEGYRGTAMGDGRAGYAKPDPYGAAYNRAPPHSKSPVSMSSGYGTPATQAGALAAGDHLPQHTSPSDMDRSSPHGVSAQGVSPAPAGVSELPHDGGAARWQNPEAAEIDGQPAMSHQSGPVYEMPTESYR